MFLYSSISTLMMISRYRIGTGLRANPVGGQGVIKLITQHVIGTNHRITLSAVRVVVRLLQADSMSDWIHYDWNTHVRYW
nr:hypothetical protein [Escherichia coli]